MTKTGLDGMIERNWGRVINVSSVNGQKGAFGRPLFGRRSRMHGFTRRCPTKSQKSVTVNTISPGYIAPKW